MKRKPAEIVRFLFVLSLACLFSGGILSAAVVVKYDFTTGSLTNFAPGATSGNGTIEGSGVSFESDPIWGIILQFTANGYVTSGLLAQDLGMNGSKSKTVTTWVNMAAFNSDGALFDMGNSASNQQFSLRPLDGNADSWRLQYISNDQDFRTPNSTNEWMHVAVTYGEDYSRVFVNGQEIATLRQRLDTGAGGGNKNFEIGRWQTPGGGNLLNGKMANMTVYNHSLSPEEIYQDMISAGNAASQAILDYRAGGNVRLNFDGLITSTGARDVTLAAGSSAPLHFVNSSLPGGRQVLELRPGENQYFTLQDLMGNNLLPSDLGIGGANTRTITVLARVDEFNDGGLFDYGVYDTNQNFSWRTLGSDNEWYVQLFGGGADFPVSIPNSKGNWGLYTLAYDGRYVSAYYNGFLVGKEERMSLNSTDTSIRIAEWAGRYLVGQLAEFHIDNTAMGTGGATKQFNEFAKKYGGFAYSFDDAAGAGIGEAGWLTSGGTNAIRSAAYLGGDGMALVSHAGASADLNVRGGNLDCVTGMAWGPIFTVLDETASISMKVSGPDYALDLNSLTQGGAGVALWDVAEGKIIESTFRSGDNNATGSINWYNTTIPLTGLEGKEIMLVGIDRDVRGYGWFGLDSVSAPLGSVMLWDEDKMHRVVKEWTFDAPGDASNPSVGWDGWYEVEGENRANGGGTPINGDGIPVHFSRGTGELGMNYYIDSEGIAGGKGFVASAVPVQNDDWGLYIDRQTGILRSPAFTLEGDIIEFMMGGHRNADLAFELMVFDGDEFFVARSAISSGGTLENSIYDYWNIAEYAGMEAYLRFWDSVAAGNGWVTLDNIRMLDFAYSGLSENDVPEPGTWLLLTLGLGVLYGCRRKQK